MLRNFLKTAWRNLISNRAFSAINIIGLSVGLAVCLIILLFIHDERSYDLHHNQADQLYRINTSFISKVDQGKVATSNALVSAALKQDLPEVAQSARLLYPFGNGGELQLSNEGDATPVSIFERKIYWVDSSFLDIFKYQFLRGNDQTALSQPNTIVISEGLAHTLYGKSDPIGKTLKIGIQGGKYDYRVTGVFRSVGRSHIEANAFMSMQNNDMWTSYVSRLSNWATDNIFLTYIRLKPGTDPAGFEKKLTPFLRRHGGADIDAAGAQRLLSMQAVKDIHLHSKLPYDVGVNGDITYLYILGTIAVFILIIACVNFMNLATARAQKRAKEVGIRKVVGALRGALILQFLGESLFLSAISLGLALLLVMFCLPAFNTFSGKSLTLGGHPFIITWIAGLTLLTGFLAGIYPAFYLSSFRPIRVLKGQLVNSLSALFFRKGLVVFQFTISVFLILASLVTWRQLTYLGQQDLGFKKDQQIVIPLRNAEAIENYHNLKHEIAGIPQVASVSGGSTYPGIDPYGDQRFYTAGHQVSDGVSTILGMVDYNYIETLGMQIIKGRTFIRDIAADTNAIILNETAVRKLSLDPSTAVGTEIYAGRIGYRYHIVGIVRDFNFKSLRQTIDPYGILCNGDMKQNYVFLRTKGNDYQATLGKIQAAWKKVNPNTPFDYSFMDKDFQRTYDKDVLTARIVGCFTILTILIACLGLFGLAAFTAEQRVREIGIRKVLGCSVGGITTLLSKDFIRLVAISILIASPLGWWAMNQWLQDFAYRIKIEWWMFLISGFIAIAIALLTVSSQAIRAALVNPIKSLRSE